MYGTQVYNKKRFSFILSITVDHTQQRWGEAPHGSINNNENNIIIMIITLLIIVRGTADTGGIQEYVTRCA